MIIGMCACGHRSCRFCGGGDFLPVHWAPPLSVLREQESLQRMLSRLNRPRFKRHADGRCSRLPSYREQMLGVTL